MEIKVEWTGRYPNLCSGRWIITINDKNLPIPNEIADEHMKTYGTYSAWEWCNGWDTQDVFYEDGLEYDDWIEENWSWLNPGMEEIEEQLNDEQLLELYRKICETDWRHGSCGGCI